MKPVTKAFIVVALLIGAAGIGVRAYYASRTAGRPEVRTGLVTRGSVTDAVAATGTLQAVTTVQVGTQVSGSIAWLGADFNSIVRKGQVIAKLDPSLFETQVEQARANLTKASADLDNAGVRVADTQQKYVRAKELADRQLLATSELDAAKVALDLAQAQLRSTRAQVAQAQAALSQAQLNLSHTIIASPIDGIVIARSVDVGQTVAASLSSPTVFSIAADLAAMQLNASIDESDIGRIRPGQPVTFQVDAYPDERFSGTVSQVRLQPNVVQNVTTYSAMIDVPNPGLKLKPGMTANVDIEIAARDNVVRVPNAALRFRPTPEIFEALGQPPPAGAVAIDAAASAPEALRRAPPEATQAIDGDTRATTPDAQPPVPASARTAALNVAPRDQKATTIDALFGPLALVETAGRVWIYENDELSPVAVRLGVSDGQFTELIAGDLQAGTALATAVATASGTAAAPVRPTTGFFMPGGPGGRPGGG